jgi:sortase A
MDMVPQITTRSAVYEIAGRILSSIGVVLACCLAIRVAREAVESRVVSQPNYLVIASTPVFQMPPATPLPTITPTPMPTATPLPLPAVRLSIPAIKLNTSIQEISPTEKKLRSGESEFVWDPVAYAVAHYDSSANPGGGGNIVLTGHNNTLGEVFRDLNDLQAGDEVILYDGIKEFHYQVQEKIIIPYVGSEASADAQLQALTAPRPAEMVTLISCWPYATNASRIVVLAVPLAGGDEHGG